MSQQTLSQLASLESRPDPAADTLVQYQALPIAHYILEEATYLSGALGVDDVVGWAASLDPSTEVIHIDLRSPTRKCYLWGKAWSTTLWRELRSQLPSVKFLHLTPLPATIDQLLHSMRTNPVGKPKDAHVQVYPTTNLVYSPPPPHIYMVCLHDLVVGATSDHSFPPSPGTLPAPGGGRIWASPLSIPPSPLRCTSLTSPTPPCTVQVLCNGTVVPHAPPPSLRANCPSALNPIPNPLMG